MYEIFKIVTRREYGVYFMIHQKKNTQNSVVSYNYTLDVKQFQT